MKYTKNKNKNILFILFVNSQLGFLFLVFCADYFLSTDSLSYMYIIYFLTQVEKKTIHISPKTSLGFKKKKYKIITLELGTHKLPKRCWYEMNIYHAN